MKKILLAILIVAFTCGIAFADWDYDTGEEVIYSIPRADHSKWLRYSRASGTLAETLAPAEAWEIREIRLHLFAAGGTGTFKATLNSAVSSRHDMVLTSQAMSGLEDYHVTFAEGEVLFRRGDELDFSWENPLGRVYGLEVRYKSHDDP